jgi:malate synthase
MPYVQRSALLVDAELDTFVSQEVLAPIGLDVDRFWSSYSRIVSSFGPRNDDLLRRRDQLQALCDGWHAKHRGAGDPAEYEAFLSDIGYLEPDPAPFRVDVKNVDAEIGRIAGPQLVVPLSNDRFALNAANARWGSLYDAIYGTNVIAETEGFERGSSYNSKRGERVISLVSEFLAEAAPLQRGDYEDVVEIALVPDGGPIQFALRDGSNTTLRDPSQYIGYRIDGSATVFLVRNNGLHFELVVDRDHPVGRQQPAGLADVILESAVTTIQDCEDSVATVDARDKVGVYQNWLGLMRGSLEATFEKSGTRFTRRLQDDRCYVAPGGRTVELSGRSLLLIRNVGLHLLNDAVCTLDGAPTYEGMLDAAITVAIGAHDVLGYGRFRNSATKSIYIVKPKLHGSAEVEMTVDLFDEVEKMIGLSPNTVKIGIMDEERRTSVNLAACIAAARERVIFINTGFLDRTGDEIHTVMSAGPVVRKDAMRSSMWLRTYEDRNVDVGLRAGLKGVAQIGKGMWAMPDAMAEMVEAKINHPLAGASCAWVPSPTAATLHAMHYHRVQVVARQDELAHRQVAPLAELLVLPMLQGEFDDAEIQEELENNAQGILGYVVRWVEHGIGCSKVLDVHSVAMMEDRATLRISSQHIANWLFHDLLDEERVLAAFLKMAAVVDEQNRDDLGYAEMAANPEGSPAFQAALELVFSGRERANGYTEPTLNKWRRHVKVQADQFMSSGRVCD